MPLPITTRGSLIPTPLDHQTLHRIVAVQGTPQRCSGLECPLPTCGEREGSDDSHARFGEAWHACFCGAAAQVVEPGERQTDRVEREVDHEGELRTASQRDRLAEAARDQIAAAGA